MANLIRVIIFMRKEVRINKENYNNIFNISWDEYDKKLIDYIVKREQSNLLSIFSNIYFNNFPENMPKDLIGPILARLHLSFIEAAKQKDIPLPPYPNIDILLKESKKIAEKKLNIVQEKISILLHSLHFNSRFLLELPAFEYPNFKDLQLKQELITMCSYAEGFIIDSVNLVLNINEKYKSLNLTDKDKILFKILYGNFIKKIKNINKEFDFNIVIRKNKEKALKKLICIRNIIAHNNSRINNEYLELFNCNLKIGGIILLDEKLVEILLDNLGDILYYLYKEVSIKILRKTEKEILPIPNIIDL